MTWNVRRKGWMSRRPVTGEPITVPPYPSFSPASIAGLLSKNRSTVAYWMTQGKLEFFRDNIGEPYVLREELMRFMRDYLHVEVKP